MLLERSPLLKETKTGGLYVKSMYKVMDQSLSVFFPHLSIWNPYVPNRVGFFAWEAFWGKVLTLEKLKRWRRVLAN